MHGSNEDLNAITQGNLERDCPLSDVVAWKGGD